jgi:hypothetical protein
MEFKVGDLVTTRFDARLDTPPNYVGLQGVIDFIDSPSKICQVIVNKNHYTFYFDELILQNKLWRYGI